MPVPTLLNPMGRSASVYPEDLVFYMSGETLTSQKGPQPELQDSAWITEKNGVRFLMDSYVKVNQNGTLPKNLEPFTASFWLYAYNTTIEYPMIIASRGDYANYKRILLYGTGSLNNRPWYINIGTVNKVITNILPPPSTTWHLYTLTFFNKKAQVYADGVFLAELTTSGQDQYYVLPGNYNFANGFNGTRIREVRLYNRALSSNEILNLYNNTRRDI